MMEIFNSTFVYKMKIINAQLHLHNGELSRLSSTMLKLWKSFEGDSIFESN